MISDNIFNLLMRIYITLILLIHIYNNDEHFKLFFLTMLSGLIIFHTLLVCYSMP